MTLFSLQTGSDREAWRRVVIGGIAGAALAATLFTENGAPTASAQPAQPTTTEAPTPTAEADGPKKPCTGDDCNRVDEEAVAAAQRARQADQVLQSIHAEYAQGDGGGQISKLIDDAMLLRRQGFRPSGANATALIEALDKRPNQTPLVEALKETIAYQRKLQLRAQQSAAAQGPIAGPVPVLPGMGFNPVG
ncbi:hypothetical protein K3G64_21005 [Mycobacterium sp. IDR2000157661]|nr:hypothetical protein K3G64_21005 [Mycobacterium sp. IDR2000157661]